MNKSSSILMCFVPPRLKFAVALSLKLEHSNLDLIDAEATIVYMTFNKLLTAINKKNLANRPFYSCLLTDLAFDW